jgi:hypothetical protein
LGFYSGGFVVALVFVWRLWGFGVGILHHFCRKHGFGVGKVMVIVLVLVLVWLWFWCCRLVSGIGVVLVLSIGVFPIVVCSKGGVVQRNYERLVPINDGVIRVGCQYLSPKRCNFSPLRRRFCDVSFGLIN